MLIAHISDFHGFAHAAETSLVRADAADAARKVVEDIAAYAPAIDAAIFTGDLVDGGTEENYALLKDILAPLDMPVFVVPGNHDTRVGLRAAFRDTLSFPSDGTAHYAARIGGIRLLALDTLVDGQVYGTLDDAQLAWLDQTLAADHPGPTIVAVHHPPCPSGMDALDVMALRGGKDRLGQILSGITGPVVVLAGHIHRPFQAFWNGAFCQVGGGPSFQHALDLRPNAPEPGRAEEPYAYFILRFADDVSLTIHKRFVSL